jgi:mono/diheme cytochrome c family protein
MERNVMKMSKLIYTVFLLVLISVLSACSSAPSSPTAAPTSSDRVAPPAEYAGKTMPGDVDAAAGNELFQVNCASCHGEQGHGDGPAASALDPAPQNLANSQKENSDDYLFWRISEGGMMEPFKSAMPSWKSVLSEEQIWDIIGFIHTLSN